MKRIGLKALSMSYDRFRCIDDDYRLFQDNPRKDLILIIRN